MWLLCGCYKVSKQLICGCYVVSMWFLCGFYVFAIMIYVVALWLLYGCYVVAIWLNCGCYVNDMCRVADSANLPSDIRGDFWTASGGGGQWEGSKDRS